jgi:uncharacterized protein with PIN domain
MEELNADKPDRHSHLRDHEEREKDGPEDAEDGAENLRELHFEAAGKREKRCAECRKSFRSDECGQAEGERKAKEQLKVRDSWHAVNCRRNRHPRSILYCSVCYN